LVLVAGGVPLRAQSDLDAFMQKVLAHRDENWKRLQQYILDERETVEVRGVSHAPIWGEQRDYTWFIRDGFFVRSPVKVNGVAVPEEERRAAEDEFLRRAKERDAAAARGAGAAAGTSTDGGTGAPDASRPTATPPAQLPSDVSAFIRERRQPDFIQSAYFLRFKFEQGTYALVGHETIDGQDVLRIEYYPTRLFSREQDKEQRRKARDDDPRHQQIDAEMERLMNKVSLVTLWVEPKAMQIVKYTFDNVNFDFLPAAWLMRVSDAKASMTMSRPIADHPEIWLPHDLDMYFGALLAIGPFDVHYHVDYHDYRQALTSGRIVPAPRGR
jgi:hypothetical protein